VHGDEIVHITVHCNAQHSQPSDEYSIHMADEYRKCMEIRLDELQAELYKCWIKLALNGDDTIEKPMVFFNSCGTTVLDPASASSFISPFYQNENSCIIATAGNVPDRLAADLSRCFYVELFTGSTVGEGLHRAKWRILEDWGNPMGLLYSIHVNAGLRAMPILSLGRES
jgi:hypothetical protein